jgi:hypothetical protein
MEGSPVKPGDTVQIHRSMYCCTECSCKDKIGIIKSFNTSDHWANVEWGKNHETCAFRFEDLEPWPTHI